MKKSKFIKGLLIGVLFLGLAIFSYNYIFKGHRNIETENPLYSVNSFDFIREFKLNTEVSNEKYLDRTIRITGLLTSIDNSMLEIDGSINCYFESILNKNDHLLNTKIVVKGRCLGYDDLMEEIKFDQCVVIKTNE
jgi:hypothetical protein